MFGTNVRPRRLHCRKPGPSRRPSRFERLCRRGQAVQWLPVLLALTVAGVGYAWPELRAGSVPWLRGADSGVGQRVAVLRGDGAAPGPPVLRLHRTAQSGGFRLCAEQRQANCVIDGDTIRYGGVKIRLADIDTPEIFSPKCASEAALGQRATSRLLELLNAGPITLVQADRDEDRYGRKLRVIARGGRSLGEILVAEGLARRWDGHRRSWCG